MLLSRLFYSHPNQRESEERPENVCFFELDFMSHCFFSRETWLPLPNYDAQSLLILLIVLAFYINLLV